MGMQKKTIERYIKGRLNSWVKSIDAPGAVAFALGYPAAEAQDIEKFRKDIISGVIVSGGCIASMLLGEDVNDIDIYFNDKEIAKKVAKYYMYRVQRDEEYSSSETVTTVNTSISIIDSDDSRGIAIKVKSQGIASSDVDTSDYQYFESDLEGDYTDKFFEAFHKAIRSKKDGPRFRPVFISSNAITLSNDIQLVFRFTGDAAEIHKNFDFVHATNYWTFDTGLVYSAKALTAILERRLYYVGSRYPVSTVFRLRKFIQRGWKISAGEIVKICWDISGIDLSDIKVLQDQTFGCDSAYFNEVINKLKGVDDYTPEKPIERTYLFNMINLVFGDDGDAQINDEGEYIDEEN